MRPGILAALILSLAMLSAPGHAIGAGQGDYTAAQLALFDTPHLDNITKPATLAYDFRHRSGPAEDFDDEVEMIVTSVRQDGGKDLEFRYLTGERQRPYGMLEDFHGNPLIMLFLQRDVDEMAARLGGGSGYLRNRIRFAFREGAEVEEATVELAGKALAGTRIVIRPYADDPNGEQVPFFGEKTYEFLLVPDVPGGLYRIRAYIPAPGEDRPLAEDSLTFREAKS